MELLCQLQNGAKVKSEDKLHKASKKEKVAK
jgi:hypothetical protein